MPTATLTVGTHSFSVEHDTAVLIAAACARAARRGGYVPLSPDIAMWVTPATPISVVSEGSYTQFYDEMLNGSDESTRQAFAG